MSFIQPAVPDETRKALDYLEAFLMPGDPSPRQPGTQRSWQQVFTLGLEDLSKGEFITNNVGWRYLIGNRSGEALYATVSTKNKIAGLSRGPGATVAFQAAIELKTLPQAAIGEYAWSVLTIPGLYTESFWLKSAQSELIVPFFTSQELRDGYPYPREDFVKIMAPLAEKRLQHLQILEKTAEERSGTLKDRSKKQRECAETRLRDQDENRLRAEQMRCIVEERQQRARQKAVTDRLTLAKSVILANNPEKPK